jgi:hypothetical protein
MACLPQVNEMNQLFTHYSANNQYYLYVEPLNFLRPLDQRKFEQLFAGGSLDGLRIAGK